MIVTSMVTATTRGSSGVGYRARMTGCADSDTSADTIIALISDQAFTRHQYHLKISTSPVPEPSASRNSQAPFTLSSCQATTAEARKSAIVVTRDTET